MSNSKVKARQARALRTRHVIRASGQKHRLCIQRSNKYIYAQLIENGDIDRVLTTISSKDKTLCAAVSSAGNKEAAAAIGKEIAKRALTLGVTKVAFDRSGNRYHGRVKALAEAAREEGLEF